MTARALLAIAMAITLASCIVRSVHPRRLTGTCEGACAHYLDCKGTGGATAEQSCIADCRQVFDDEESLRAYESLSCDDAVEYVDGRADAVTSSP